MIKFADIMKFYESCESYEDCEGSVTFCGGGVDKLRVLWYAGQTYIRIGGL